jgi:hypothetical protein
MKSRSSRSGAVSGSRRTSAPVNLARVGSIWFPFGAIYKAERPAPIQRPTVALSKCISSLNAKFGADLTDADRVPADWRTA